MSTEVCPVHIGLKTIATGALQAKSQFLLELGESVRCFCLLTTAAKYVHPQCRKVDQCGARDGAAGCTLAPSSAGSKAAGVTATPLPTLLLRFSTLIMSSPGQSADSQCTSELRRKFS